MLCAVYKSPKKSETYLYVLKRDDFSPVPEQLLTTFGTPTLVTMINLAKREKLAIANLDKLIIALNDQGFYLQLPPPKEDLLKQHRVQQGVDETK